MSRQRVKGAIDAWQQLRTVTAVPLAVLKKFSDDGASNLAALISYWSFFSLFPLLLAFTSILGFVLDGNPEVQQDILDSAVGQIPVIGDQLSRDATSLTGSGPALAVGIPGAVWAGLGVTLAIGNALDQVWAVPRVDRPGYVQSRLRGLVMLVVIATATVVTTGVVALAQHDNFQPVVIEVPSVLGAAAIDFVLFLLGFRVLTAAPVSFAALLPGTLLATVSWLGLQTLGAIYAEHVVAQSNETYGAFAAVIGSLTWLWGAAQLSLVAAEVNVVLAERLWPRSLFGSLAAEDERALRLAAQAARSDAHEHIVVSFEAESRADARRGP